MSLEKLEEKLYEYADLQDEYMSWKPDSVRSAEKLPLKLIPHIDVEEWVEWIDLEWVLTEYSKETLISIYQRWNDYENSTLTKEKEEDLWNDVIQLWVVFHENNMFNIDWWNEVDRWWKHIVFSETYSCYVSMDIPNIELWWKSLDVFFEMYYGLPSKL